MGDDKNDAGALIDAAEAAGLVLMPWPDGTLSVYGDQDADELLARQVLRHRVEVLAEIHSRAEVALAR